MNDINNNNDVWDNAISDSQFITNSKIARIFPKINNIGHNKNNINYSNIKIDEESLSYITIREIADVTSKIIINYLLKYNMNPNNVNIIDYTSGVGGNVLSFAKYFRHVYAVEIDKLRSEYLKNNVLVYNYNNVTIFNESCIEFNKNIIDLNLNVIFIDPPWGGGLYKNKKDLQIILKDDKNEISLEKFILEIINNLSKTRYFNKFKCYENKFIFLKLPLNYNIDEFYNIIKNYCKDIEIHILQKMLIITIII